MAARFGYVGIGGDTVEARALAITQVSRPPAEIVLPWIYYGVLAAEALALAYLYKTGAIVAGEPVGNAVGWAGTISMCLMHVYSVRRRVRALSQLGRLRTWLHVHIFLGLQGAMLVTFHSLHLQTFSNISGITLSLTLIIVCSGIFGRYLFSFLPRSISGERKSAFDVEKELAALSPALADAPTPALAAFLAAHEEAKPISGKLSVMSLVREDLRGRRAQKHLDRALDEARGTSASDERSGRVERFAEAARRRMTLLRRLATLSAAERLFRNWTLLHKPLAFALLGSVLLHVVSHYIYASRYSG